MRSKKTLCYSLAGILMMACCTINTFAQQGKSIHLETALPQPVVKDGSVDYTAAIQRALDTYDTVYFAPFPLKVNKGGLSLHSNQVLKFPQGAVLKMEPNPNTNYEVLRAHKVKNVKIYNANIVGDRYEHQGTKGEWGFGISIRNSSNVEVYNPVISKCWGDGIYIGDLPDSDVDDNNNILVTGAKCDDNRRNGLSVISGKNIQIKDSEFSNSGLIGIDLEPNHSGNILENINVDNVVTRNNKQYGFQISLGLLNEFNKGFPRHFDSHDVSISVNNHKDYGSPVSMFLIALKARSIAQQRNNGVMDGQIKITNPVWNATQTPFQSDNYGDFGPLVRVKLNPADKKSISNFKMAKAGVARTTAAAAATSAPGGSRITID